MKATTQIEKLLNLVDTPRDSSILRYLLATEYLRVGDAENAIPHLYESVKKQPDDVLAWKTLGDAQARSCRPEEALASYRRGIQIAKAKGDHFIANEMEVCAQIIEQQHGI